MNDSPWQPPADGQPGDVPADPPPPSPSGEPTPEAPAHGEWARRPGEHDAPQPDAEVPQQDGGVRRSDGDAPPSPWSPEGAAAWTRPPEPAPWAAPGAGPDVGSGVEAPPPTPPWSRAGDAPAMPDAPPTSAVTPSDHATGASPEPARRRSKVAVGGAVAAVGALGLAGLFAVQRFSEGSSGGAATADQLGLDLLSAIESEDVLGVIDTMIPGERDALGDPFVDLVGELRRLEVLAADTDLSRLLGLDVDLENELVQLRGTNVPDIVNVALTADATVTLDGATLPLGDFVESQLPDDQLTELRGTRLTETDRLDLELTAVRRDGTWYFSAFHTVAELIRSDAGADLIPEIGVAPDGADSPEAAVDRLLDRVEQLDLRGVIAMLDPSEATALQRYAPLFLDEAEAELNDIPLDWRVDVREFRVDGDGDERTVLVDALGITGTLDGSEFTVRVDEQCVRAEMDGETLEQCGDDGTTELDEVLGDAPAIEAFATALEEAFADLEPVGLELRQRDGAWYVSPVATLTDALLAGVRALDRDELDTLVDAGEGAVDEFFDLFFGFGETFPVDPSTDDGIVVDDGWGTDGQDGGLVVGTDDAWDRCSSEPKAADAIACFEAGVASGELDESAVPASLLHPECGMAEIQWEGGLYGLSDEEFAAVLARAVPCFEELVASGRIEPWAVPFEVVNADCFEDRNWYNVFDDQEYDDRVAACIDGTGVDG